MSVISGKVALSYSLSPLLVANKILLLAFNIVTVTPELFLFNLTWPWQQDNDSEHLLFNCCLYTFSAKVNTNTTPPNPHVDIDADLE